MRPLTKVEKGIILFLVLLLVLGGGGFLFIYPGIQKIQDTNTHITELETERDTFLDALAREATIDTEIKESYDLAKKYSENFFPIMPTYIADGAVRDLLGEAGYSVNGLSISGLSTFSLAVTGAEDTSAEGDGVTFPLNEYSQTVNDLIGQLSGNAVISEETAETEETTDSYGLTSTQLSEILGSEATVGAITATFSLSQTPAQLREFLDFIKEYPKAIYLSGFNIPSATEALRNNEKTDNSFTLTLLCVEEIADGNW